MNNILIGLLILPILISLTEYSVNLVGHEGRSKSFEKFFEQDSKIGAAVRRVGFSFKELMGARKIGNVCFGEGDLLFYCARNEDDALADLTKKPEPMSYEFKLKEQLKAANGPVYFIVAPNKLRFHWDQFFLSSLMRAHHSQAMRLEPAQVGIPVDRFLNAANVLDILKQKPEAYSYYKQDTHWTAQGAELVLRTLLQNHQSAEFDFTPYENPDILLMLNRYNIYPKSLDRILTPKAHKYRKSKSPPAEFVLKTKVNSKSALVIGDSFRKAFYKAASQHFGEVITMDINGVNDGVLQKKYDAIFVVQVERYVH